MKSISKDPISNFHEINPKTSNKPSNQTSMKSSTKQNRKTKWINPWNRSSQSCRSEKNCRRKTKWNKKSNLQYSWVSLNKDCLTIKKGIKSRKKKKSTYFGRLSFSERRKKRVRRKIEEQEQEQEDPKDWRRIREELVEMKIEEQQRLGIRVCIWEEWILKL